MRRTNELRTSAVHWVEASPQSQSQSVCVPDSVAEWESLSLSPSPRRVATMNAIVSGCRWPPSLSLPTPTSPLPLRCPITPCAAAVTLHFYFASLHRSTQYALGTKPMAWTGSASAPALTLPPPLPLPLAQRCLWLSSASGARCTNWSSWLSNFCNWSLWRQQRQRDAAATATRLQRTVPRIAHKWSEHS